MENFNFYTLLYIDFEHQSLSINGVGGKFESQMKTYIRCCEALDQSLSFYTSKELVVLTNSKDYIRNYSKSLKVLEIPFSLNVPEGIGFYSAHFKLDVIRYFMTQENTAEYFILLDNDVLCLSEMPANLANCINKNIPVYYNVTRQRYPAYGRERIIRDKEMLMDGESSVGLWAGGEFIGGDARFFRLLHDDIQTSLGVYFNNYKTFHHQGDEMLVSVAVERLMQQGIHICDVGPFGVIGRFWSITTSHVQDSWKSFETNFLVHLPADKVFVSKVKTVGRNVKKRISRHLFRKKMESRLKTYVKLLLNL